VPDWEKQIKDWTDSFRWSDKSKGFYHLVIKGKPFQDVLIDFFREELRKLKEALMEPLKKSKPKCLDCEAFIDCCCVMIDQAFDKRGVK